MRRILFVIFICLIGSGCRARHGNVQNGAYYAPRHLFELPLPRLLPGGRIDDMFSPEGFTDVFTDDFGQLYRIDGTLVEVAHFRPELGRNAALESAFEHFSMSIYRKAVPTATFKRMSDVPDLFDGAVIFKVLLPGGSNLQVTENGGAPHRMDSTRAVVVFVTKNHFMQVSAQAPPLAQQTADEIWKEANDSAIKFAQTIKFGGA